VYIFYQDEELEKGHVLTLKNVR